MNELIAARAFAGIGGGGMTTVVSILLSDAVPLRDRGKHVAEHLSLPGVPRRFDSIPLA